MKSSNARISVTLQTGSHRCCHSSGGKSKGSVSESHHHGMRRARKQTFLHRETYISKWSRIENKLRKFENALKKVQNLCWNPGIGIKSCCNYFAQSAIPYFEIYAFLHWLMTRNNNHFLPLFHSPFRPLLGYHSHNSLPS